MANRWTNKLTQSDVTPEHAYLNRRKMLTGLGLGAGAAAGIGGLTLAGMPGTVQAQDAQTPEPNTWEEITSYNNYYEFGTRKEDPARNAHMLTTAPWTIQIDGLVEKPGDYGLDDILSQMTIE